jgi:prepilin-type N-terminal cleavage/methylation domain-containing protein
LKPGRRGKKIKFRRKKMTKMINSQKGFTLIEIIAVLVILGILAAVAVPKYLDLSSKARELAAQGAIAEIKGRLSQATAKYMLDNKIAPNASALILYAASANAFTDAANLVNVGTDFTVTQLVGSASPIVITVTAVQGVALTPAVTGTFTPPVEP